MRSLKQYRYFYRYSGYFWSRESEECDSKILPQVNVSLASGLCYFEKIAETVLNSISIAACSRANAIELLIGKRNDGMMR